METKQPGISGYWLKLIAVISMLIDHTSAVILEQIPGLVIWGVEKIRQKFVADVYGEKAAAIRVILIIVTVAAGGFLALLFRTDYDLSGIVTIFAIYMFYPKKVKGMGIGVLVLTLLASIIEAAAFLDMIPVYFYNGTRGKQMKYFFYIFYPVHLFLLAMIARAMGLWA